MLAATIVPISTAFAVTEAFGWESGVGKRFADARAFYVLYTFVLVVPALFVLLPDLDPIGIIVASQYLQGLLLPVVLVFMLLLVNDRRLLGRHVNGRRRNLVAGTAIAFVIVLDVALLGSTVLDAVRMG
jgi:Mn2+/Fe2+ NRAMP family transporter